jgi:hypothetical protein
MERVLSAVFLGRPPSEALSLQVEVTKADISRTRDAKALAGGAAVVKALRYAARAFAIGYCGKTILAVLFRVVKRPGYRMPIHLFLSKDTARFGASVGLVVGIYRGMLAYLRLLRHRSLCGSRMGTSRGRRKTPPLSQPPPSVTPVPVVMSVTESQALARARIDDKTDRAIAGALAGLGLAAGGADYRIFGSKYMLVRALDVVRNTGERLQWWPRVPRLSYYLFGLINGPIMYSFLCQPKLLSPSYYKWILWMGNLQDGQMDAFIRKYVRSGQPQPAAPCAGFLYPRKAGRLYLLWDWFLGLYRASSVYFPVHLVPLLLFKTNKLMADPKFHLLRLAQNISLSCMFLSTYQTITKAVAMGLMEVSSTFYSAKFMLPGFLTAAACEFERPGRVNELMLYCATHTLDVMWNFLVANGLAVAIPYGELVPFMVACSITFSAEPEDFKPAYRSLLTFLVPDEV